MFGIVPGSRYGWPKNVLHWAGIHESVLDISATVRPHFVIADGIIAMEGDGPINGTPKHLHTILLSDDPVAADAGLSRLLGDKRFKKYQWVEVEVTKASDFRPESYKLTNHNSIRILSEPLPTDTAWKERKQIVGPLQGHCLCCLQQVQQQNGFPTLGLFRPKSIDALVISPDAPSWNEGQLAILRQGDLFRDAPLSELEKIPHKFQYRFSCDESA